MIIGKSKISDEDEKQKSLIPIDDVKNYQTETDFFYNISHENFITQNNVDKNYVFLGFCAPEDALKSQFHRHSNSISLETFSKDQIKQYAHEQIKSAYKSNKSGNAKFYCCLYDCNFEGEHFFDGTIFVPVCQIPHYISTFSKRYPDEQMFKLLGKIIEPKCFITENQDIFDLKVVDLSSKDCVERANIILQIVSRFDNKNATKQERTALKNIHDNAKTMLFFQTTENMFLNQIDFEYDKNFPPTEQQKQQLRKQYSLSIKKLGIFKSCSLENYIQSCDIYSKKYEEQIKKIQQENKKENKKSDGNFRTY